MSNVSEAFVYTYLGLTFFYTVKKKFSLSFIIWEFLFIVIGRWLSLYGVRYLMQNVLKLSNFHIKATDISVMSFCGSVRGSISFGLAISIDTPNREILISGTLVLIFVSTLFFGAIMPRFFSQIKSIQETPKERENSAELMKIKNPAKEFSFKFINPNIRPEE
jgi:NhaP-type Na+/H+ or K+/H+ antiporter